MTDKTEIWLTVDAEEDPIAYAIIPRADEPRLIEVEVTPDRDGPIADRDVRCQVVGG
jgi:hypothetical protein